MNWYLQVLKKYAVFDGRARRTEFWMFVLFNFIISLVLGFLDGMFGTVSGTGVGLLGGLYMLVVLIPGLAVSIRRLHDTNRSGWWVLIGLVPIIGWIIAIIFYAQEGTRGPNQYGQDPKEGGGQPGGYGGGGYPPQKGY